MKGYEKRHHENRNRMRHFIFKRWSWGFSKGEASSNGKKMPAFILIFPEWCVDSGMAFSAAEVLVISVVSSSVA